MGILDFLGGSSESGPTKLEKEITKELLAYGKEVGKIPYQPWAGLDIAAFRPQQNAGMQAFADMGNAFGMGMPTDVTEGLANEYTDASGNKGYSGFPAFLQNLEANKGTAAADRYAKFYDLPKDQLYGKTELGSVTGLNPAGPTPGSKGTPGTGTGGSGGGSYPTDGQPWWSLGGGGIGWQSPDQPIGPIFPSPGPGGGSNIGGKGIV